MIPLTDEQVATEVEGLVRSLGEELRGRTCLVTGATSGIGRATATALVARGAAVILLARDRERGTATAVELMERYPAAQVYLVVADLSSLASVRAAASELKGSLDQLHVLVNSAAQFVRNRRTTEDGLELMFATNYLGPFLLTNLLMGLLLEGAPARIINVTAPSTVRPLLDDLQGEKSFRPTRAFGASKAANLLFTFALARRLEGTGVTVNAFHPGVTRTKLMRGAPVPMRLFSAFLNALRGRPPEKAGEEAADLALSDSFEGVTGRLFQQGTPVRAPFEEDVDMQEALWKKSEVLAGLQEPAG